MGLFKVKQLLMFTTKDALDEELIYFLMQNGSVVPNNNWIGTVIHYYN